MTRRERVLHAIDFKEPDRVPIDFGGHRSSGVMAIAYAKLRDYLGLEKRPIKVYDMIQQLAVIDPDVLDRFDVDVVEFGRAFDDDEDMWKEWVLPDGTECLIPTYVDVRKEGSEWVLYSPSGRRSGVQREGMLYFDQIYWPYQEGLPKDFSGLSEALDDVMWSVPTPPDLGSFSPEVLGERAERFRNETDRAVVFIFGGNLLELSSFLMSIPEFMMLLAGDPERAHDLLEALTEHHLANLEKYLPVLGPYIDIVLFGDDLGMQSGPQISPDMYREFFKSRHSRLWNRAKELADVKVQLHSCGGIRPLLDDLIEAGLDIVNPVQTSAVGMDPGGLKRDFGGRVVLWGGGADTQSVLPNGSPREVREHVRGNLEILAPGGGFVFQQVHNVMANVTPENITAMFETVRDFNDNS
jgi:uroporphyrinogen decarboxylase